MRRDFFGARGAGRTTVTPGHGFALGAIPTLPVCNEAERGMQRWVQGGTGVADVQYTCLKGDDDTYAWVDLSTPYAAGWVLLYSSPTVSTAVNTTASETAFDRSFTVPANSLVAGDVLRLRAWGTNATHSSGTVTLLLRLRWGGAAGVILAEMSAAAGLGFTQNYRWVVESTILVTAVGASGVAEAVGTAGFGRIGALDSWLEDMPWIPNAGGTALTVDTTANKALVVTVTLGASNAANTATLRGYTLERMRA
jgi:hypothetical protein